MKRTRKSVPRHDQNGSRPYLAEEVKELRAKVESEIRDLRSKVEALNDGRIRDSVALSTLLEDGIRARDYREQMSQKVDALRAEQGQVPLMIASMQASIEKISKLQGEHETERQQIKGAANLAKGMSGAGWGFVGLAAGGLLASIGWLSGKFQAVFGGGTSLPGPHP